MKPFNKLEAIAQLVDGDLRLNYSGRGMYGNSCLGIVTDDPTACMEYAAQRGITGAKMDNMGRQYIVYWPNITKESA